jgi:hypothetical protein
VNFGNHREAGAAGGAPEIRDVGGTASALERVMMAVLNHDRMKYMEQEQRRHRQASQGRQSEK